jgi:hypothetical protein
MPERILEVVLQPDGRFLASSFDDGQPTVEVTNWEDIRRLRGKRHLVDHWSDADRQAFIASHGHPFDDWWAQLSPSCAAALIADPHGPVPFSCDSEVKRTLRHQPRQAGLELYGSQLSPELRAFVAQKADSPE